MGLQLELHLEGEQQSFCPLASPPVGCSGGGFIPARPHTHSRSCSFQFLRQALSPPWQR